MSTFKVTLNGSEFEGAGHAAGKFIGLYPQFSSGALNPTQLFTKWIEDLVDDAGVVVTYGDGNHLVSLDNGKIKANINGQLTELHLKGDDDNFNQKKVLMITPAVQPDVNAQYLINAIQMIKNSNDAAKNQAFLLGTILMKRCR